MYQSVFLTFLLLVIILQMRTQGNSPKLLMGDSTSVANLVMRVVTFKAVPRTERLFLLANSIMELIKKTALLKGSLRYAGGAQVRLRTSLIPLFPRDIKDEKRNEGKKEKHVKNVKRLAGQEGKC